MSFKNLSGYYAAGYTLKANYSEVNVLAQGGVGGTGLRVGPGTTVNNSGKIHAEGNTGVGLTGGGIIYNGVSGTIYGDNAIVETGVVHLTNLGSISSGSSVYGVQLEGGGSIVNGSYQFEHALIGYGGILTAGAAATITNFGAISATTAMRSGGAVINGATGDTTASMGAVATTYTAVNVANFGMLTGSGAAGSDAISLGGGGNVTNGAATDVLARIQAATGVQLALTGSVTNFGAITGTRAAHGAYGVLLANGGVLANGSATDRTALVSGYTGVSALASPATVVNMGAIEGLGAFPTERGVYLKAGGRVVNGSGGDAAALIAGATGIAMGGTGTVLNYGAVEGERGIGALLAAGGSVVNFGSVAGSDGVAMYAAGAVTNGTASDTGATIEGYATAAIQFSLAGTVTNFGTLTGAVAGLYLSDGGKLTNGSIGDGRAMVSGYAGVSVVSAAGTIANYATILAGGTGADGHGVYLGNGGRLTNGGGADRSALIEAGGAGVDAATSAQVANFATIQAGGAGVVLLGGGSLSNGSANNHAAVIEGYTGAYVGAASTVSNFGTIAGLGDAGGSGLYLVNSYANVINGAAGHTAATIEGYQGIIADGPATVTNFGTIAGGNGNAVSFVFSNDRLNVEAGSTFVGAVEGGGGTINLASGVGTLTNIAAGDLTVSGSMAATTFDNFDTLDIGAAATFTAAGVVAIMAVGALADSGVLNLGSVSNAGTLGVSGGTLSVTGAISGKGVATIFGGTLDLAVASVENITFLTNAGQLELGQSQGYTGTVTGFAKTSATSFDLVDIAFVSASEATFSGTTKGGVLTVTDGTHTALINLKGNYLSSTWTASSDGHGGTIVVDPTAKPHVAAILPSTAHQFIAASAALGAGTGAALAQSHEAGAPQAPALGRPRISLAWR